MLHFNHFEIIPHGEKIPVDGPTAVLQLIAGDASDRKFYRLYNGTHGGAICMQFPKWEGGYGGDPLSWIGMHDALNQIQIPIPQILKIEKEEACIWTQDLGDTFLSALIENQSLDLHDAQGERVLSFYKEALDLLINVQYPDVPLKHPASGRFFDFEKLHYEMNFFTTHFLNGLLNLNVLINQEQWQGLFKDFDLLCQKLSSYEKVLCHRDYHSRNLMLKDNKIYWIDFQDARMGPHSYDVVSLIRDSYVDITWETRNYLFSYYLNELNLKRQKIKLKKIDLQDFHLETMLTGLQRNVKALGSFGYLATSKSKRSYLKYVLPTLETLCHEHSYCQDGFNLKIEMPHLFGLLHDLRVGKYSDILKTIVANTK